MAGMGASDTAGGITAAGAENTGFIILISCVATIGGFLFGFDSGVINGTVDGLQQAFGSSKAALGFEVASMLLGCAIGAFFAGRLADRWGRRSVLIAAAVLFLLSALGSGAAPSSLVFIAARVLGGFAVGAASVMSPAYIAEVAPARYRGRLATVQQIAIISGLFAAFLSNYLLAQAAGTSTEALWAGQPAWRWMFWMMASPSALFLVLLLVIPESPRFLVVKRRKDQALAVLSKLYGPQAAQATLAEIEASLSADHHRPTLGDLVNKATGKIRPIVWVGSAGMAVSLALVVWAFASGSLVDGHLQLPGHMGTLALVAANVYVVFFNVSWGPVMWVMLGEMFPNQIRGSGLAVAGAAQWTSNFAVTMSFPILLAGIGLASTYAIYMVAAFISVVFVLKYVHETKGIKLEQMGG